MKTTNVKNRNFRISDQARQRITLAISMACIFLFALSAYEKLADLQRFSANLARHSLIGNYASYLAPAIPIAEIAISVLLIYPPTQKTGLYGFAGLMTIFTLYISAMLLWAEKMPCHCNLIVRQLSFAQHLWFNIGFILLALWGIYLLKTTNHSPEH